MSLIEVLNGLTYKKLSTDEEKNIISLIENDFYFIGPKIDYARTLYFKEYENMTDLIKDSLLIKSWNADYYYVLLMYQSMTDFSFVAKMNDLYPYIYQMTVSSNIQHFFYSPDYKLLIEPSLFPNETTIARGGKTIA